VDEIQAPAVVRCKRRSIHRPTAKREFSLRALSDLQICSPVDPPDALVVIAEAVAVQQHRQARQAIAPMIAGKRDQTQPQWLVVAPPRAVVKELAIDVEPTTRRPFIDAESFTHGLHCRSSLCRPQKFPSATIFSASMLSA